MAIVEAEAFGCLRKEEVESQSRQMDLGGIACFCSLLYEQDFLRGGHKAFSFFCFLTETNIQQYTDCSSGLMSKVLSSTTNL